ncbi:hypothetical protein ROA7023_01636 [Roseisalinus antarcticus]|uniref:Uncharacterized protein n=1 Tax=Roseisalinus antarcticus TaxID=254357 RepID=A0A1Y5SMQ9_9RHOB|nr:hypothetical protein ROA7023_01636 [Roseisalinus antarcticus]
MISIVGVSVLFLAAGGPLHTLPAAVAFGPLLGLAAF